MTETIGTGNSLDARLDEVYRQAVGQLFSLFEKMCEGAIAVDDQARIAWINDKYRQLLGLPEGQSVVGVEVEEIIPHSQMRSVVKSGRPILLDVMPFGSEWFVVTRLPVFGEDGKVLGGVGYVLYDRLDYLKPLVNRFLELQREIEGLRRELSAERRTKYTISSFIGSGAQASQVKRLARRAARLDAPILLLGETGTGKELLAHGIHAASARADRPFVPVNVAAVPEGLLESEFFGAAPFSSTNSRTCP
jgi:transcriptional regulator with PAS, ATPase and Fis domain